MKTKKKKKKKKKMMMKKKKYVHILHLNVHYEYVQRCEDTVSVKLRYIN